MSQWDKDYIELCKTIIADGRRVVNRTGVDSVKVPAWHFRFDLEKEFPILTTKQVFIRQAALEMLWIYQAQSNDVRWLQNEMLRFGMNGKLMMRVIGTLLRCFPMRTEF